jgi:predicted lipid-binding transport protein (Tim44 family)
MNGFMDISTLIILVIAVVIFVQLRRVLGRRTGNERPPYDPYSRTGRPSPAEAGDKVVALPRRGEEPAASSASPEDAHRRITSVAAEGSALGEALRAVIAADPAFDPQAFLAGARTAYEMVVTAFAEGDRKTLKQLLSREVYDGFVAAITAREQRQETIEFKFVGIDKAEITDAAVKAGTEQVTVRFATQSISATRDKTGAVVDGDPAKVSDMTDVWTFAREVASRDPNWKLIATEAVD